MSIAALPRTPGGGHSESAEPRLVGTHGGVCDCGDSAFSSAAPWWRILIAGFLAVNSMVFAIAVNTSEVTAGERRALQGVTLMATLAVSALLAKPLITASWASLQRRQVTTEALFVLSYLGALGVSTQSMIRQRGPVFWEVAGILLVVYSLGRSIGRYTQNRIVLSLAEWNPMLTFCDRITSDGNISRVQISELQPGDLVRVHPGETIPIDGRVTKGSAFVREAEISGESFAVSRTEGDLVSSGTTVLDATLEVSAITTGCERRVDRIRTALESLEEKPA